MHMHMHTRIYIQYHHPYSIQKILFEAQHDIFTNLNFVLKAFNMLHSQVQHIRIARLLQEDFNGTLSLSKIIYKHTLQFVSFSW